MLDTTSITTEITKLIACGTPEGELLFRIARRFLDLSWAELSAALEEATAAAEREAVAKH